MQYDDEGIVASAYEWKRNISWANVEPFYKPAFVAGP